MELISECFVKSKREVPAARNRIYLKPVELLMLGIHPITKGLLYEHQINPTTLPDLLKNLKHSLSIALSEFYPLAGRFVIDKFLDDTCVVFIDCNAGPGAKLTHVAATNITTQDLLATLKHHRVPDLVREFFDLGEGYQNCEGHTRPLLSIQVTQLQDGIFIGFSMNHCVVDGTSFMHFLSMLSEIFCFNNINISRVPIYGPVRVVKYPYSKMIRSDTNALKDTEVLRDRIFHISARSMGMIKAKANQDSSVSVSSFQGLVSLVWRAITKARNLAADQETAGCMMVNARSRLDPPLSDQYFGNYISQVRVICKVGELLSNDLGWAARRLNEEVQAQDNNSIHDVWNQVVNYVTSSTSSRIPLWPNAVVFGGSPRFDMYELDFGLGKASSILMGCGKEDGTATANPGRERDGSIDLQICLKDPHMTALEVDQEFMAFAS